MQDNSEDRLGSRSRSFPPEGSKSTNRTILHSLDATFRFFHPKRNLRTLGVERITRCVVRARLFARGADTAACRSRVRSHLFET